MEIEASGLKRRSHAEDDPGQQRNREREAEYRQADFHLLQISQLARAE